MPNLPHIITLPYHNPPNDFEPYADSKGSFFLDSSLADRWGRFSFWGFEPKALFESRDGFITFQNHTTIASPFASLKELYQKIVNLPFDPYFPFCGGLVGFLGYEWGAALENVEPAPRRCQEYTPDTFRNPCLPDSWFGLYDTIVGYNHLEKSCWVSSLGLNENFECDEALAKERAEKLAEEIQTRRKHSQHQHISTSAHQHNLEFRSSFTRPSYIRAIGKILDYLRAGDCYQVNLTQQFMAAASMPAWEQYLKLRQISPAPYACFLNGGTFQILSSSPECFLQSRSDGTLTTRPIKGTRRRGQTPGEDQRLKEELGKSAKDQAEILMITDLERNDLGKVCVPGSVEVPELRTVESFAQVHHLLSTVRGERKKELDIIDCLAACLPGGSITGAPKIRAMQIIQELEPVRRGVYTGAIGWLGPANTAHFNIAIRTIVLQDATAYFSTGGGIVIDSNPEEEYQETFTKAQGMMQALGITGVYPKLI